MTAPVAVQRNQTAHWYCVHTKPRAEAQALEHLQRQAFECLLPRIQQSVLRGGRRQRVVEPLFPRYLFLRANPEQQSLAAVRSTRGALGLVRFANLPGIVPQSLIDGLHRDTDAQGVIVQADAHPQPGDAVTVMTGALAGLRGVYWQMRGDQRAEVLLQLLGGAQRVLLAQESLQKAGPAQLS